MIDRAAHLENCLRLAVAGTTRAYPHHGGPTLRGDDDLRPPRDIHPAFYGCFDWHSAVHAHWTMVRVLRVAPGAPSAADARAVLDAHLTVAHLEVEAELFRATTSFERPYGWAWVLRLEAELRANPNLAAAARAMAPLADAIRALVADYLPRLRWPVRAGTHANTAFAVGLMLDAAHATGRDDDARDLAKHARRWFEADANWPLAYEPSGEDFLSPALTEADCVRRVLPPGAFADWLACFLPAFDGTALDAIEGVDLSDGRLGHLAGLNLSRARALRNLAAALPADDPRAAPFAATAERHLDVGLTQVRSGAYAGEHWLGTFAVDALTELPGIDPPA